MNLNREVTVRLSREAHAVLRTESSVANQESYWKPVRADERGHWHWADETLTIQAHCLLAFAQRYGYRLGSLYGGPGWLQPMVIEKPDWAAEYLWMRGWKPEETEK